MTVRIIPTEDKPLVLRLYESGEFSTDDLAAHFLCSPRTINRVVREMREPRDDPEHDSQHTCEGEQGEHGSGYRRLDADPNNPGPGTFGPVSY